jgi:hypothetical protein
MDRTMFEGSAGLETVRHERPAWIQRLEEGQKLEGEMVAGVGTGQRLVYYVFGYAAVAAGLYMLVGALANFLHISW